MKQFIKLIFRYRKEITFRNLLRFAGWMSRKFAFVGPHTVLIDIINQCDMHCLMCWYHSPLLKAKTNPDWENEKLALENYASLIKELKQLKTDKVYICGCGEPLLHPDIEEMVSLACRHNLKISINTNGVYLDRKRIHKLLECGLSGLDLSLHAGDRETFQTLHPKKEPSLFDKITSQFIYLSKVKKKLNPEFRLTIINVISRPNYKTIGKMFEFARMVQADKVVLKPVSLFKEIEETLSLGEKEFQEIKSILHKLKNISLAHNIPEFLQTIESRLNYARDEQKIPWKKNPICHIPWTRASIATNGDVLSCIYGKQEVLGNILRNSFNDIYHNQAYQNYRKNNLCPTFCLGKAVYPFIRTKN